MFLISSVCSRLWGPRSSPSEASPSITRHTLLTLSLIVPVLYLLCMHIWLRSAYTAGTFELAGFSKQYEHDIYRYRIIGPRIVGWVYRLLTSLYTDEKITMPSDPLATRLFYLALIGVDAFFFCISNLLILILCCWPASRRGTQGLSLYLYVVIIMLSASYVVTPYDQLAYALLLGTMMATSMTNKPAALLVFTVCGIVGALTRETQVLATPALLTVAVYAHKRVRVQYMWMAGYNLIIFATVYIGLRAFVSGSPALAGSTTLGGKWAVGSIIMWYMIWMAGVHLAMSIYRDVRPSLFLLVSSIPYLATILMNGILRELRLIVPLLLTIVFIYSRLGIIRDASGVQTHPGTD